MYPCYIFFVHASPFLCIKHTIKVDREACNFICVFVEEELQEREVPEEEEEDEDDEQDIMKVLGKLVMAMFIKYWIYVCGGMFFFVSFEGRIVMYKIIYMMLFLFCVVLYQVNEAKLCH